MTQIVRRGFFLTLLLLTLTSPTLASGRVFLGDTGLPLSPVTVNIGGMNFFLDEKADGQTLTTRTLPFYQFDSGVYAVTVKSALGEVSGERLITPTTDLRVELPSPWDNSEFVHVASFNPPRTIRWNKRKLTFSVSSQLPKNGDPVFRQAVLGAVKEFLQDCQGLFTFTEVSRGADIEFYQVPDESLDWYLGSDSSRETVWGKTDLWPGYDGSIASPARVYVVASKAQSMNVLKHELGHTVGLGHSKNPAHLMYNPANTETHLTPAELNYLKALYSLSPGTDLSVVR